MTAHPDCAQRAVAHKPHTLASPGGNKPGTFCEGNGFCLDCKDHEACMGGYPCDIVMSVNP